MPSLVSRKALFGQAILGAAVFLLLASSGARAQLGKDDKPLEPKHDLTCLVINKNSGRCMSVEGGSSKAGARIVQGPLPEQADASERWTLLGDGKTFRLRNHKSRLVVEIGSANVNRGVQPIQWHDRPGVTHLLWTFEPVADHYRLHAGHVPLVLAVGQGSQEPGARVIQWTDNLDVPDQYWELRPAFQEHYWSFKDNADKRGDFEWIGPDAEECVKFEAAGLRITLPPGQPDHVFRSIAKKIELKEDFEITMGYEILSEPAPADSGLGSGVFLAIDLQTQGNRAAFTRDMRGRATLTSWFELTKAGADAPFKTDLKSLPTTARAGQLRLTRIGTDLLFEAATPAGSDFTLVQRYDFSDEQVEQIRLGGVTGGTKASVDARVIDLRIRAKSVPGAAARVARGGALPDAGAEPPASRSWLVAGLLIGTAVVFLLALAVGGWLTWRRLHAAPAPKKAARDQAEPAAVSFACPSCGKNLKVKAASVGKKLKCPQCNNAITVPTTPLSTGTPGERGRG